MLFSILVAWVAVFTVTGQAIDTLSMEAAMRWAEPLGAVGSAVTHIISVPAMVAVGGLIVLIAWLRRRPTLAGRALGMIVAANTTTQVAKLLIDRPDFHVSAAILNSLPSGHTTVAMSLALALVMIAPEWFRGPAAWIGYIWTSLVGISVMVFGWHRPADVLVAMAICGFWALILCPLETRVRHGVPVRKLWLSLQWPAHSSQFWELSILCGRLLPMIWHKWVRAESPTQNFWMLFRVVRIFLPGFHLLPLSLLQVLLFTRLTDFRRNSAVFESKVCSL